MEPNPVGGDAGPSVRTARAKGRYPWFRILLWLVLLVVTSVASGLFYLVNNPQVVSGMVNRAVGDPDVLMSFGEFAIRNDGVDPSTWSLQVSDIDITTHDKWKPDVTIERLDIDLPSIPDMITGKTIHCEWARVVGMRIHTQVQRPAPPWNPARSDWVFRVDRVDAWDVHFRAEPDPPLKLAQMDQIYGSLSAVRFALGPRELSGRGTNIHAKAFHTGALLVENIVIGDVVADRSDILVTGGSFLLAGGRGALSAEVRRIFHVAAVRAEAKLMGAPLEKLIEMATDNASPIIGVLDAEVVAITGGTRPRGKAYAELSLKLTSGFIPLPPDMGGVMRAALKAAPIVQIDKDNRVILGQLEGDLRMDRGNVEIVRLVYQAPVRPIEMWGHMNATELEFFIRQPPLKHADERVGIGVVIFGDPKHPKVRLGKKEEMLAGPFATRTSGATEAALMEGGDRQEKREARQDEKEAEKAAREIEKKAEDAQKVVEKKADDGDKEEKKKKKKED